MATITSGESLALLFRALGDPTRLRIFQAVRLCGSEVAFCNNGVYTTCSPVPQKPSERDASESSERLVARTGEVSVGNICCQFDVSKSTMSHHLRELRMAGLIKTEKRGRSVFCSVDPQGLALVRMFLEVPQPKTARQITQGRAKLVVENGRRHEALNVNVPIGANKVDTADDLWMI